MSNASTDARSRNTKYVYLDFPDSKTYAQPYDWESSVSALGFECRREKN